MLELIEARGMSQLQKPTELRLVPFSVRVFLALNFGLMLDDDLAGERDSIAFAVSALE